MSDKPATVTLDQVKILRIRAEASIIAYLSTVIEALGHAKELARPDPLLARKIATEHHHVLELLIEVGKRSEA